MDRALLVHVPPEGLSSIGDVVEAAAPGLFPLESASGAFDCDDDTTVNYTLQPVYVTLSVDEVAMETANERLDVTLYATLGSTASTVKVTGDCLVLQNLNETCDLQIPTASMEIAFGVQLLATQDGFEARADDVTINLSRITNPIANCTLASAAGTLLGQNPTAINDLLLGAVEPQLEDLPATLETAIEEALNAFTVETSVDLLGTALDVKLEPTRLELDEDGMIVGLSANFGSDSDPCADLTLLDEIDPTWPHLTGRAEGTSLQYDAGAFLGRDLVEGAVGAIWGAGTFCATFDELQGLPLNGAFVGPFFGTQITELIGTDTPALLSLTAPRPPTTRFYEDQPAVRIDANGLSLALISELDYRRVRILDVGIDAQVGIDLGVVDGTIAPTLVVDDATFVFTESYSELITSSYTAQLGGLVDTVLALAVPDEALAEITLPQPLGAKLGQIFWRETQDEQWLGAYTVLDLDDVQPIAVPGCDVGSLGCDGGGGGIEFDLEGALGCDQAGGCGGGCSSGRVRLPAWPLLPLLFLCVLVGLRRRRVVY